MHFQKENGKYLLSFLSVSKSWSSFIFYLVELVFFSYLSLVLFLIARPSLLSFCLNLLLSSNLQPFSVCCLLLVFLLLRPFCYLLLNVALFKSNNLSFSSSFNHRQKYQSCKFVILTDNESCQIFSGPLNIAKY